MAGANYGNIKTALKASGKKATIEAAQAIRAKMGRTGATMAAAIGKRTASAGGSSRDVAIERMRAAAKLINNGTAAEAARGERAFGVAVRQLRASRAEGAATKHLPAKSASKAPVTKASKSEASAPKSPKPIVQHGQMQVHANADGTYSLRHAASGREVSGGLTKSHATQLASYFGRGTGVEQMRKARMGDAKAHGFVEKYLADARVKSAARFAMAEVNSIKGELAKLRAKIAG